MYGYVVDGKKLPIFAVVFCRS